VGLAEVGPLAGLVDGTVLFVISIADRRKASANVSIAPIVKAKKSTHAHVVHQKRYLVFVMISEKS
jgi:hypothetical protein